VARVNVDQKALTDSRFAILARLMGTGDRDTALGRMIRVWNECIERETYELPTLVIETIFDQSDAPDWLIESGLAERSNERSLRIKGTEGRIEYLAKKRANAKRNGKLGGRPPKTNIGSEQNQRRLQTETPPAPAPAPAPAQRKTPPKPPVGSAKNGFDRFWDVWPKKVAKEAARKAWSKLEPDEDLVEVIIGAVWRQAESREWQQQDGKYIPYPATWLNGRRWEDESGSGTVLSDFDIAHGTADPVGGTFRYNTRLCRDPNCEQCKPKRGGAA
jgi:hypothetical protein